MDGSIVSSIDRLKYQAVSQPDNQPSSPPVRPSVAGFLTVCGTETVKTWVSEYVREWHRVEWPDIITYPVGRSVGRSVGQARINANIRPFPRLACNFFLQNSYYVVWVLGRNRRESVLQLTFVWCLLSPRSCSSLLCQALGLCGNAWETNLVTKTLVCWFDQMTQRTTNNDNYVPVINSYWYDHLNSYLNVSF